MDRRGFVVLALAGALLGGCAGSAFRPLKPEVTVADIRAEGGNLLEQRFLLTLRVTNPNRFEIPVEGVSFTLDVAGEPFARGVGNKPVTIPAMGEALVEVKATAGLAGLVLRQFKNLGRGLDKLEYRLQGRLVSGSFGAYDFDQRGELDPARLIRDGRPAKPPSEQF